MINGFKVQIVTYQQVFQLFNKLVQLNEVLFEYINIKKKEIFDNYYRDSESPLYVKCQKDDYNYHPWFQFCSCCSSDHEPKYSKHNKLNIYTPIAKNTEIKAIDIEGLLTRISEFFGNQQQELMKTLDPERTAQFGAIQNNFPLLAKPTDQCYSELLTSKIQLLADAMDQAIKECQADSLYRPAITKVQKLKSVCKLHPSKMNTWNGICSSCHEAGGHSLYIISASQTQPIELTNSVRVKVINCKNLREQIFAEFRSMINKLILARIQSSNNDIGEELKEFRLKLSEIEQINENQRQNNVVMREQANNINKDKDRNQSLYQEEITKRQFLEDKKADDVLKPILVFDTFYDVEINCESILKLTAGPGWNIKINSKEYELRKQQNSVVVSFYGLYNKGKSFLASKLSAKSLPLGYSVSTIGLSALYPRDISQENAIIFLDTAGTETPICYQKEDEIVMKHIRDTYKDDDSKELRPWERKNKVYEMKLKDRLLTEHMLQRFILSQSNIVLVVVDQLTKEEQLLIQKIKNLYEKNEIIIIHNFSKLVSVEDVQSYIESDILESFEVQEQTRLFAGIDLLGKYFVERRYCAEGTKLPDITHVIMGYENSDAGKHYNVFCYHYLKSRILAQTESKKFDIINNLIEMLKMNLPEIIDIPPDKLNDLSVEFTGEKIITNVSSTNLKSISFDLLGDLRVFKGGLDPKYSITKCNERFHLDVEICGPFYSTERDQQNQAKRILHCKKTGYNIFEWHGFRKGKDIGDRSQYIMLRGVKPDVTIPKDAKKAQILMNDREKGEFRVIVPINPAVCVLRDDPPEFHVEQGIISFRYILQTNTEEIDFF